LDEEREGDVEAGKDVRRSHLLAAEDDLAQLEADSGVVDDKGDLAWFSFKLR